MRPLGYGAAMLAAVALALSGCASLPRPTPEQLEATKTIAYRAPPIDPKVAERILALDPKHLSEHDVRDTLSKGPTPHVLLIHGGIYPVHLVMISFGRFLAGMGYPEDHVRDPGTQDWSLSPYEDSSHLAGMLAWYFEHDGVRPMIVGHSQGGIQAVKVLRELSGQFTPSLPVWNPLTGSAEDRVGVVDPLTGKDDAVVGGIKLSYVSVVGAGGAALMLPNQWSMIGRVRTVPDAVEDFTGFFIEGDTFAWTFSNPLGSDEYRHNGTAKVRNVVLPFNYNHVMVPDTDTLARDRAIRDWINAYVPGQDVDTSTLPKDARDHVLWAADVWYSIKETWCREAQRYIRARRGTTASN